MEVVHTFKKHPSAQIADRQMNVLDAENLIHKLKQDTAESFCSAGTTNYQLYSKLYQATQSNNTIMFCHGSNL